MFPRSNDFNSRPSARGDILFSGSTLSTEISIHAPPRGATVSVAPAVFSAYFNSRPSARGDHAGRIHPRQTVYISIHAPPRGATFSCFSFARPLINFNSRPSARGDRYFWHVSACLSQFQFTPLREGRLSHTISTQERTSDFNSRPSARGDPRR